MSKIINNFAHLHRHDSFSLLDGLGLPEQAAKKASELGFTHLAISNHASSDGLIKHQLACEKYNVIPIAGVEFYITQNPDQKEKGTPRGHITVWIKDIRGYVNVLKMLSLANLNYFYHRPRIGFETLLSHAEGLCVGTACSASFLHLDGGIDYFEALHERFGEDLYLEVMPFDYDDQIETNNICLDLSEQFGVKLIATNDCHYIEADDHSTHDVLLACQTKKKLSDPDRWRFSCDGLYLCEPEFMVERFKSQGVLTDTEIQSAMANTMEIARKCENFRIERKEVSLPIPPQYAGMDEENVFKKLIIAGAKKRLGVDICL